MPTEWYWWLLVAVGGFFLVCLTISLVLDGLLYWERSQTRRLAERGRGIMGQQIAWRKNALVLYAGAGALALTGTITFAVLGLPPAVIVGLPTIAVTGMVQAAGKLLDPEPIPDPPGEKDCPAWAVRIIAEK